MNTSIPNQLDREKGVDIRPSSTALFGISSFDRYASVFERNNQDAPLKSPFNTTISSSQPFIQGQFTRIGISEVVLRWYLPTLTSNNNRIRIRYSVGGTAPSVPYFLSIPVGVGAGQPADQGWYTPTTLAAALQTAVRTATGNVGFTVTASTINGAFRAQTNNTDTFVFVPFTPALTPNRIGLFEMMNWPRANDQAYIPNPNPPPALLPNPPPAPFQATGFNSGVPTMCRTQFVDIVCSQLTGCQGVKDADTGDISRDLMCRVYLNDGLNQQPFLVGSTPFVVHRDFSLPKQIKWLPNTSVGGFLKFELYDDQGYLLESGGPAPVLDNQQGDWNLTLQLSEV
jgi:hypothetical protein